MSNTVAQLVRALAFACLFPLSAAAIAETKTSSTRVVSCAPSLTFDAQRARFANVEGGATVRFQHARARTSRRPARLSLATIPTRLR